MKEGDSVSEMTERRIRLLTTLSRRRYDTIENLAIEFGVSPRTMRRDIETLSAIEPIYTKQGRYEGGVYVLDGYFTNRIYLSEEQEQLLRRLIDKAKKKQKVTLGENDVGMIEDIIKAYKKPSLQNP